MNASQPCLIRSNAECWNVLQTSVALTLHQRCFSRIIANCYYELARWQARQTNNTRGMPAVLNSVVLLHKLETQCDYAIDRRGARRQSESSRLRHGRSSSCWQSEWHCSSSSTLCSVSPAILCLAFSSLLKTWTH
jgi:hypothetical protein